MFVAFMGHWGWTLVAFTAFVVFMRRWGGLLWCFRVFVVFMGLWRCTFGTWVLFSFCMFLHVQRTWVPPGLAYRGSGFSKA